MIFQSFVMYLWITEGSTPEDHEYLINDDSVFGRCFNFQKSQLCQFQLHKTQINHDEMMC